ncbi:MAG: hypothetical protein HY763_04640 [Planctomycetes bacterium]|nr:hypothetical protein [Planctomycetota bacterium]
MPGCGTGRDCNGNGALDACDIDTGVSPDLNLNDVPDECDHIVYVDASRPAGGDGLSWATAFNDLQPALATTPATQIWVATGTYRPTASGNRTASFNLPAGIEVYGGFPTGGGDGTFLARDAALFVGTVLSGDLLGNDVAAQFPGGASYADNSYHVVRVNVFEAAVVLDGLRIYGGNADGPNDPHGGGIELSGGDLTLRNCTFERNAALDRGGAVYNDAEALAFEGCMISNNAAKFGGGIYDDQFGTLTMTNCVVVGNTVTNRGGGLYSPDSNVTSLTNCTFAYNTAGLEGGGIRHIAAFGPGLTMTNCIVWGNQDPQGTVESSQLALVVVYPYNPVINNSCVQGWTGTLGGVGNFGNDPLFVAAPDNLRLLSASPAIDVGDNAAIAATGLGADVDGQPRVVDGDRDGTATVDLGAYEQVDCNDNGVNDTLDLLNGSGFDCNANTFLDACEDDHDCDGNQVPDECHGSGDADFDCLVWLSDLSAFGACKNSSGPDDPYADAGIECVYFDIDRDNDVDLGDFALLQNLFGNRPAYCDVPAGPCNAGLYETLTVSSNQDTGAAANIYPNPAFENRVPLTVSGRAFGYANAPAVSLTVLAESSAYFQYWRVDGLAQPAGVPEAAVTVDQSRTAQAVFGIYVDDSATGANNGSSWNDAFTDLQDALALAAAWANSATEIWVAQGTYHPDRGTGDRQASFALLQQVSVLGGFAGVGAADPNERNPAGYPTVLSGDLLGDDGPNFANRGDNSLSVLRSAGADASAVLDGCTVRGGNGESTGGGGMSGSGSPALRNCTFTDNFAVGGGAIHSEGSASAPVIEDCRFVGNRAWAGGAIYNILSAHPTLNGCEFSNNTAVAFGAWGGAMYNANGATPTVTDCTFIANSAESYGGAIYNVAGSPALVGCYFDGNSAVGTGGAVYSTSESAPTVSGCAFVANHATLGGALGSEHSAPLVTNCTFDSNTANEGGALYHYKWPWIAGNPRFIDCTFALNSAVQFGGAVFNDDYVRAEFTGCLFDQNAAGLQGGAMWTWLAGAPAIRDCRFAGNHSDADGGALYYSGGTVDITDSTFYVNYALKPDGSGSRGGAIYNSGASGCIANCKLIRNVAFGLVGRGGGIYNYSTASGGSALDLTNCLLDGNASYTGTSSGGAIYNEGGTVRVRNCTLGSNWAMQQGGAIHTRGSTGALVVSNSVLWSNVHNGGVTDAAAQIYVGGGSATVSESDVQGCWTGAGSNNICLDPLYRNLYGPDGSYGTEDDDLRVVCGSSPVVNNGGNALVPPDGCDVDDDGNTTETTPIDLDGQSRIRPTTVDMGAYECPPPSGGGGGIKPKPGTQPEQ